MQEAINQKIVSYNKLAKILKLEIEEELGKNVKHSAIVMALRRSSEKIEKTISKPKFSYSIETIKTDIFYLVLEDSPDLYNKLATLYPIINYKKGGLLNVVQGNYEVAVVTNSKYKEKVLDILFDENILETIDDLVSISLTYSKDFLFTPGILYDVSRFLAWENINAIDVILTKTEFSLIVNKNDLMRCYKILGRFAENSNNAKEKFAVAN
jgi:hypothetical protein